MNKKFCDHIKASMSLLPISFDYLTSQIFTAPAYSFTKGTDCVYHMS